jgi:type III secretion protein V
MSMPMSGALPALQGRSRYSDLLLVGAVVAILAMMVLPLPSLLIDVLLAVNISSAVVLLLVALYITSPLEFSVFPSVLLLSTLFRLALSIASTRLLLLHGQAGHIIDTFGHMVAGGNLVVGLVVFLIITVVQFIVVAKGAERVAEVAARFTLDAMPGKQLSIDSDLRSGLIDKDEAKRKRLELEMESKLHGSLDGAMKFVKGDAIAGIVIIVINLLGGLAIGVMQQGMDVGSAMVKYSILTIGDGMVAQIPALLSAMSAGLIVTRATDEHRDSHLGDAIGRQIAAKPRVLLVAAGLCVLLATVPGFPWPVFLILGMAMAASGALLLPAVRSKWQRVSRPAREAVLRRKDEPPAKLATALPTAQQQLPLLLEVSGRLMSIDQSAQLVRELEGVLDHINLNLGLLLPRVTVHVMHGEPVDDWRLMAFEVPIAKGSAPDMGSQADLPTALAQATLQALRRHTALFFGTQETSALLNRAGQDMPEVVKEVLRALPLQKVAEVMRRLLEEEVAIRNVRDILEALSEAAQREKDVFALTEMARIALKRQLSYRVAPGGKLRAVLLSAELEETLRQAVRVSNGVQQLALDPAVAKQVMDDITAAIALHRPDAVLATVDIRRHVRKLIDTVCFDTPVLSFHELVPTLQLDVAAHVQAPQAPLLQAA